MTQQNTQATQQATQELNEDEMNETPVERSYWGQLASLTGVGPSINLEGDKPITFGRQSTCDHTFTHDGRISGVHCVIERVLADGMYDVFVTDKSSNGTFVNGERVGKGNRSLLRHSDRITFIVADPPKDSSKSEKKHMTVAYMYLDPEVVEGGGKGDALSRDYDIRETLGSGNFSVVKLGVDRRTGQKVAVKIIEKKSNQNAKFAKALKDEVDILTELNHPNIITIYRTYDTERCLYLVLELVGGGELFDSIIDKGHYSEYDARVLFRQMAEAIKYMHDKEIIHRDLKPDNILLSSKADDAVVKISDFGLARTVGDSSATTFCGTPQYLAPEVLTDDSYGKPCDIWSLGVILYILLSGLHPFTKAFESSVTELFKQIKKAEFSFEYDAWKEISDEAKNLVSAMMTVDPEERLTIDQVMTHDWMVAANPSQNALKSFRSNMMQSFRGSLQALLDSEDETIPAAANADKKGKKRQLEEAAEEAVAEVEAETTQEEDEPEKKRQRVSKE